MIVIRGLVQVGPLQSDRLDTHDVSADSLVGLGKKTDGVANDQHLGADEDSLTVDGRLRPRSTKTILSHE